MIAGSPNRRSCGPLAPYVPTFGGDSARHGRSLPLLVLGGRHVSRAMQTHSSPHPAVLCGTGPGSRPARTRPVRPAPAPSASRRRGPAAPVPGCEWPRRGPHAAPCRWWAGPLRAKAARSTWTVSFPGARIQVWLALDLWLKDPAIALADTTEPTDVERGWCGWSVFSQAPADGHALGRRPEGNRELAQHIRKGT